MNFYSIYFLSAFFLTANGLKKFTWDDLPEGCGSTRFKEEIDTPVDLETARIGEVPWLARIGMFDVNTKDLFFFCTGSLIHKDYVVTAAHCGAYGTIVRLGEHNLATEIDCVCGDCAEKHQDVEVEDTLFADHCRVSNTNDLSVLVLKESVKFNGFVEPICLPQARLHHKNFINKRLKVAGWGVVYSGWGTIRASSFKTNNDLMVTSAPILNPKDCHRYQRNIRSLGESEFCVGYAVKNACVSDSGGPIVQSIILNKVKRVHLIGVASHDLLLCENGQMSPVIYTDVSYHSQWIVDKIDTFLRTVKSIGK